MRNARTYLALVVAMLLPAVGSAQQGGARPVLGFDEALAKTAAYQVGDDRAALYALEQHVLAATASPEKARQVERSLLRALEGNSSLMGKDQICRRLSTIGSAASVPALTKLLASADTADMGRYALERIPMSEVDAALRGMLSKTSGKVKVGIVNALGRRRNAASVRAIGALIPGDDPQVAMAAAAALGQIGDRASAQALAAARSRTKGALRAEAERAYLRCGELVLERGDDKGAFAIFKELNGSEEPMVRIGALRGLAQAGPREAIPLLSAAIKATDAAVQAQGIRQLSTIPGAEATTALMQSLDGQGALGKIRVLAALADRGDRSALPALLRAVKDNAAQVRIAALQGLEQLGDESVVMLLAQTAVQPVEPASQAGAAAGAPSGGPAAGRGFRPVQPTESSAARASLSRLRGSGVDKAILEGIAKATPAVRAELILAASERGMSAAADTLLLSASDSNRQVRVAAYQALRGVAGPAQVGGMLALLTKTDVPEERREMARALAAAVTRSEKASLSPVTAAYQSSSNPELKTALLSVLSQTGRPEALPVLRGALKDPAADIRRAAVLALPQWPDPAAPMPDLLEVVRTDQEAAIQILALQSYLRLAGLPSDRTPAQTASLLSDAMKLARRAEEKRTILSLAGRAGSPAALALAESAMQDPEVSAEARAAADQIRQRLAPARKKQ